MSAEQRSHTERKCSTCGHPESIHDCGGTACDTLFCNCNRFVASPTREEHEQARRMLLAEQYQRRLEALPDDDGVAK